MRKFLLRSPFLTCVILMTLLFLPFFTSLLYPALLPNTFFEDSFAASVVGFLFVPGLFASILLFAPITSLFHWSESFDLTVLFFLGGMISVVVWSLILYRIYKRFLENREAIVPIVIKAPIKKMGTRKKKK